jgi:hypothetical protein
MRISIAIACLFGLVASNKVSNFFQYSKTDDLQQLISQKLNAAPKYNNITGIPYDKDMNCESCVRSGFDFCIFRTFPDNVTHGQFSNCTEWAITPEFNSVTNVNETDRWMCSGAFMDQMNGIVSMCNKNINPIANRNPKCGPYMIDLTYTSQVDLQNLNDLDLGESCTYRLHTKCGLPKISWYSVNDTTAEYDIIFNTHDNLALLD